MRPSTLADCLGFPEWSLMTDLESSAIEACRGLTNNIAVCQVSVQIQLAYSLAVLEALAKSRHEVRQLMRRRLRASVTLEGVPL